MRWIKRIFATVVVLGLLSGAGYLYYNSRDDDEIVFRTDRVTRGDLLVSIGATGTLEPEESINVGAQVAGRIMEFGTDANGQPVDYNSPVKAGMVLARIDDSLWKIEAAQADAQVMSAEAGLRRAQADLLQYKARLLQAQRDWDRARKLGPSDALAQASYDAYESAFEAAKANVAVGEAAIGQAGANLAQAKAGAERAQRNLGYCTITSPVDGVIIDRRVNLGQTVVASLNAPSLFLIAKDLRRMQVWVPVNEADVNKIRQGGAVTFTVNGIDDATFHGKVQKVRLFASVNQNVVTYIVEIQTDNPDNLLKPYLTAEVKFELARRDDVLAAPSQALQWWPTSIEQVDPAFREVFTKRAGGSEGRGNDANANGSGERGIVWTVSGKYVRPIKVRTGLSDGASTEVMGEGIQEGTELVTGVSSAKEAAARGVNPFAPVRPGRGGRSGMGGRPSGGSGSSGGGSGGSKSGGKMPPPM
jgi:HlyD family secretion protein